MGLDHFLDRTKNTAKIIVARKIDSTHAAAADLSYYLVTAVKDRTLGKGFELRRSAPISVIKTGAWRLALLDRRRYNGLNRLIGKWRRTKIRNTRRYVILGK